MTKSLETIREAVRRAPLTNPVGLSPEWQAYFDAVTPLRVADLIAALEQAQDERDKFKFAFNEWHDKTEWVQKAKPGRFEFNTLGMHRADVMTRHIAELEANQTTPTGMRFLSEAIGAHAYIVGVLMQGRPDLALEESRKWVDVIQRAASITEGDD